MQLRSKNANNLMFKWAKESEQTFLQGSCTNGQQACEKVLNIINHQGNVNQNQNEIIILYLC